MRITVNSKVSTEIRRAIQDNDGYCPCSIERTPATKCMCEAFIASTISGDCHCGLYHKEILFR